MRRTTFRAMFLAVIAAQAVASDGEWSSGGPFGGQVHEIVIDPGLPTFMYVSTPGGIFRSTDGGISFQAADDGIVATTVYPLPLMLDAENNSRLYTSDSSGRLYRTVNGGDSWTIDRGNLPQDIIPGRMVDTPGTSCEFLMGTSTQRNAGEPMLWRTTDCGDTYVNIGSGLPLDETVAAIAYNPAVPGEVLVGLGYTTAGRPSIYRSTDGGLTFTSVLDVSGTRGYAPEVFDIRYGASGEAWASVDYQLFHSLDDGQSWIEVLPTGPGSAVAAGTVLPIAAVPGKVYVGRGDGVYVVQYSATPTPGYTLTAFSQGLTPNPSYLNGPTPLPAAVNRLAATPDFPASGFLFASTDGSGLFKRAPVDVMLQPPWVVSGAMGPGGSRIMTVQVHPNPSFATGVGPDRAGQFVYAGQDNGSAASTALHMSEDAGRIQWFPANNGLRAANIRALVVDPTMAAEGDGEQTVWFAGGSAAVAENAYRNAGLYMSTDNAMNWTEIEGNLPDVPGNNYADLGDVHALALDARSCASPPVSGPCTTGPLQRLYAVADGILLQPIAGEYTFSHQILRSDDRGITWTDLSANPGFPSSLANGAIQQKIVPVSVATSPTDSNLVLVGTRADYLDFDPGTPPSPADLPSGLFRSTDRGATWTHVTAGLDAKDGRTNTYLDVTSIAVHPNGTTVWIAATDLASSGRSAIYRSLDAGQTFTRLDDGINPSVYLRALAVDPVDPDILYAVGSGYEANPGAVYRSPNGGEDWYSISVGLPAESAYAIAVDPHNPLNLLVGTDQGVFSMTQVLDTDFDGIPDAVEDAGPNNGDGNNDGILDSLQGDVGSIGVALRGNGATETTVDVINGIGPGPQPCRQAVDVHAEEPDAFGGDLERFSGLPYSRPEPALTFELLDCREATIDVTFHGSNHAAYGWGFRYFGPASPGDANSIAWYGLPATSARRTGPATWRLTLTHTGLGNYRPPADDAIRFSGTAACAPDDRVWISSFEAAENMAQGCYPP